MIRGLIVRIFNALADLSMFMAGGYWLNGFSRALVHNEFEFILKECSGFYCFVHSIFGFWFLVTFGNKVMKILHNFCLHISRQDGQDRKKNGKKIEQKKWEEIPKKPNNENMVWTKFVRFHEKFSNICTHWYFENYLLK